MKRFVVMLLAAVLALTCFSGCAGRTIDPDFTDTDEEVTLTVYVPFNTVSVPGGLGDVTARINEITKREINARVNIIGYNYGEYTGKMNNTIGAGTEFDHFWTNASPAQDNFNLDSMYPIGNRMREYAPTIVADFEALGVLGQLTMPDGNIYALPNMQILPRAASQSIRDHDLYWEYLRSIEEFSSPELTQTQVEDLIAEKTVAERLDLIENYLKYCKDNNAGAQGKTQGIDMPSFIETFLDVDDLCQGVGVPGVIYSYDTSDDGKIEVVNQFKLDGFKEAVDRTAKWYRSGYIPKNVGQVTISPENLDTWSYTTWKPFESTAYVKDGEQRQQTVERFGKSVYKQSYILGTMWSVSATSKNPARALKFLELMYTNAEIHNLLKFGIEGKHYDLIEAPTDTLPGVARQKPNSNYSNAESRWILGNEFNGYVLPTQDRTVWTATKTINETAYVPEFIGFVFDRRPVINEIQACNGVWGEYSERFKIGKDAAEYNGSYESLYDEFIAKMDRAGADAVIAEKQRQLNEWLAKQ